MVYCCKDKVYVNGNDDIEQSRQSYEMIALFTKFSIKIP